MKKGSGVLWYLRMWRKERWKKCLNLAPQQVMFRLWYQNRAISPVTVHNGLYTKSCFVVRIWTLSKKKPRGLNKD
ncbi:hypothetical protein AB205_0060010 [Aquarana catesbeiana]|uniref:Uncharacterized protein n=1 Tax=Aquarana catesbeiana TaxID=8400 RepID=A0A2G9SCN8_AQUCT|nr:hypothetical protein AB205_0060010 [Aquarana catesbeiana]